jgi:hypothetical protein
MLLWETFKFVVSLLMSRGVDVRWAFLQVVALNLHVHTSGHGVNVATPKTKRMAATKTLGPFLNMFPEKYNNSENFVLQQQSAFNFFVFPEQRER